VVERTFSWLDQNRRMSKDYERLCASAEAFIYAAMIRLMVRRLVRARDVPDSFGRVVLGSSHLASPRSNTRKRPEPLPRFLAMIPFGGRSPSVASLARGTGIQWGAASIMRAVRVRTEGEYMAVRVLLVLAIFVTLYGCGQMGNQNGHPDKKDAAAPAKNKQAMVEEKAYNSAEVDLQPANGSGTRGTATFSKAEGGGVKVLVKLTGFPRSATMYLAHIHPGTCAEEEGGGAEHGHSHHEHGATEEIEYPLTPLEPNAQGDGTSTTVVHGVTLEGLLSGEPKHVNVHKPGPGEPPPVTCADLSEAR
jgi:predicted small lipoprotein YifL